MIPTTELQACRALECGRPVVEGELCGCALGFPVQALERSAARLGLYVWAVGAV